MSPTSRELARLHWTREVLDEPGLELEPASADASFRSYWRTRCGDRTWIVMDAPPDHEDIRPWLEIARRLSEAGLHAPQIRAADAESGFVLMSDLGGRLYLPELNADSVEALYADALQAMHTMQSRIQSTELPPYDEQRLVAEMELLPEWFLQRHLSYAPSCDEWDVIELAFRALSDNALRQEQAFVHRDYHSRNLLVCAENSPGILDFQDAVRGPITYDLASLLRDCYIAWPDEQVYRWVELYRLQLHESGLTHANADAFRRDFDLMGLQRHFKVLGIFCRLWYRDGKASYLNDLPLVWRYARDVGLRYPETAPLIALIERALGDANITLPRP